MFTVRPVRISQCSPDFPRGHTIRDIQEIEPFFFRLRSWLVGVCPTGQRIELPIPFHDESKLVGVREVSLLTIGLHRTFTFTSIIFENLSYAFAAIRRLIN